MLMALGIGFTILDEVLYEPFFNVFSDVLSRGPRIWYSILLTGPAVPK